MSEDNLVAQWSGITWKLHIVDTHLIESGVMMPGLNTFQLVPQAATGVFEVVFNDNEMATCWRNSYLTVHGDKLPAAPAVELLPQFSANVAGQYFAAASKVRAAANQDPTTYRLDGVIKARDIARRVRFYQVMGARKDGAILLVLDVKPGDGESPDGSGVGDGDSGGN